MSVVDEGDVRSAAAVRRDERAGQVRQGRARQPAAAACRAGGRGRGRRRRQAARAGAREERRLIVAALAQARRVQRDGYDQPVGGEWDQGGERGAERRGRRAMPVELDGPHGARERIEHCRPGQIQSECVRDVEGRRARRASRADEEGGRDGNAAATARGAARHPSVRQRRANARMPEVELQSHAAQLAAARIRRERRPAAHSARIGASRVRRNGCEEDESMRSFVFGAMVGAMVMYFT